MLKNKKKNFKLTRKFNSQNKKKNILQFFIIKFKN